jgi:hypothetical protein
MSMQARLGQPSETFRIPMARSSGMVTLFQSCFQEDRDFFGKRMGGVVERGLGLRIGPSRQERLDGRNISIADSGM